MNTLDFSISRIGNGRESKYRRCARKDGVGGREGEKREKKRIKVENERGTQGDR